MMVDDDHLRLGGGPAHSCQKAGIEIRALLTETDIGARVDAIPDTERLGEISQLASVTRLGPEAPVRQGALEALLGHLVEDRIRFELPEPLHAQVIVTTLHVGGADGSGQGLFQERDILEEELLLEILRAGRDDGLSARFDRGYEVGEG